VAARQRPETEVNLHDDNDIPGAAGVGTKAGGDVGVNAGEDEVEDEDEGEDGDGDDEGEIDDKLSNNNTNNDDDDTADNNNDNNINNHSDNNNNDKLKMAPEAFGKLRKAKPGMACMQRSARRANQGRGSSNNMKSQGRGTCGHACSYACSRGVRGARGEGRRAAVALQWAVAGFE